MLDTGEQLLSNEYVLLSLVNQALVLQEADRQRIDVSEDDLDAMMVVAKELPVLEGVLRTQQALDDYRTRLRAKLRFDAVKAVVVSDIRVTDRQMREYYALHREAYPLQSFHDVKGEIETLVAASMVDQYWRDWLAGRRSCSEIRIADEDYHLPPETFEGRCPGSEQ